MGRVHQYTMDRSAPYLTECTITYNKENLAYGSLFGASDLPDESHAAVLGTEQGAVTETDRSKAGESLAVGEESLHVGTESSRSHAKHEEWEIEVCEHDWQVVSRARVASQLSRVF